MLVIAAAVHVCILACLVEPQGEFASSILAAVTSRLPACRRISWRSASPQSLAAESSLILKYGESPGLWITGCIPLATDADFTQSDATAVPF